MMSFYATEALATASPTRASTEPSLVRLYALRGGYLLLTIGLGVQLWPAMIDHATRWALMQGIVNSMLVALSLLAILGLRYPLKMLPLLFFEMAWKGIWMARIALPLWLEGRVDPDTAETIFACSIAIIFPIIIPWSYVFGNFARATGDRWW
jgi:hypothetical protein